MLILSVQVHFMHHALSGFADIGGSWCECQLRTTCIRTTTANVRNQTRYGGHQLLAGHAGQIKDMEIARFGQHNKATLALGKIVVCGLDVVGLNRTRHVDQ